MKGSYHLEGVRSHSGGVNYHSVGVSYSLEGRSYVQREWVTSKTEWVTIQPERIAIDRKGTTQGVTKRCRLSWLTNSALVLVYEPKCGGVGELRGISQWVQLYTGAQINLGDLTPYLNYTQKKFRFQSRWDWNRHASSEWILISLRYFLVDISFK